MSQVTFSIRMEANLKKQFEELCEGLGMNMTTAFNVFAKTVVREQRIPFELSAKKIDSVSYSAPTVQSNIVADNQATYSATPIAAPANDDPVNLTLLELIKRIQVTPQIQKNSDKSDLSYSKAIEKWRCDTKALFDNPDDAKFLQHAFEQATEKEPYKEKDIW